MVLIDSQHIKFSTTSILTQGAEEIVGKTISLVSDMSMESTVADKDSGLFRVVSGQSIVLKVVGIYDSSIGYQTEGDVWLPLSLKQELMKGKESTSSRLGAQLAVRTKNQSKALTFLNKAAAFPYLVQQSKQTSPFVMNQLQSLQIKQVFFQTVFLTSVLISLFSLSAICFLITSERRYDFALQRALGASRNRIISFFGLEMFFAVLVGILIGLQLVFFLIWSDLRVWLYIPLYMEGGLTLVLLLAITVITVSIALLTNYGLWRRDLISGISGEE